MRTKVIILTLLLAALATFPVERAVAHGGAELTVEPQEVPAGQTVTLTGTEMEDGETFALSLVGLFDTFPLGEATVSNEGFSLSVTIPEEAAPGSYTIQAISEEGEAVSTELTVTATEGHDDEEELDEHTVESREPTAARLELDRRRSAGEWFASGGIILLGGLVGLWLIRQRG